jgi:micrococcal nuclease
VSKKQFGNRYALSRFNRTLITLLCLLIALVFTCVDRTTHNRQQSQQAKTEAKIQSGDIERYHNKTFTVIYVVDGDTLDINTPDGKYNHTRIQLWGVDTLETKMPDTPVGYFGPEASEFTKKTTLGKQVKIYLDEKNTRDKYNRLLAYIQFENGRFLNEELLSEGFAYADRRFKHLYYNKYKQLESAARKNKKGLWANVTRDQLPQWLQKNEPTLLNKK